jgi:cytochrome c551
MNSSFMKSPWLPLSALLVGMVMLAFGCGQSENTQNVNILDQDRQGPYAKAVQLYEQSCESCHGANLEGDVGPNLQHIGSTLSESEIECKIAAGGGPMPAFKSLHILSDAQIKQLAEWLATKK